MEIVNVSIVDIVPYENNPRKNDQAVDIVAKSIKEFGFLVPIILDNKNKIVAGHTRIKASIKLGMTEVPCIYAENLTEEQIKAFRIMDNKSQEWSTWDWKLLKEEIEELIGKIDLSLTGFNQAELDFLLKGEENLEYKEPKYQIEEGDLYEIGEHKVICGDATNELTYSKLLNNETIKLVITSPPYNMKGNMYQDYKDNLESQVYIELNLKAIKNIEKYLKGFIFWNLSYNKNSRWEFIEIFHKIITETNLKFVENIIWDKGHGMPINSREGLTREYEQIMVVGENDAVTKELDYIFIGNNTDRVIFRKKGLKALTNYWRITTEKSQTQENKAMFPEELPRRAIYLMSDEGDIVLDCFGGIGTTAIACHKTNRKARIIELDPKQCSFIIERLEKITGIKSKIQQIQQK